MTSTSADAGPRSSYRALGDLRAGWAQRPLWGHLGWQDIRQRYRRSFLGPIWISITMAVTAIALGVLYAGLFDTDIDVLLPHLLLGFVIWNFISGCITEGAEVFTSNEGLITHLPAPLSVHLYRLIWRQFLFLLHNAVVYVLMLFVFPQQLHWTAITVVPALLLLAANGAWAAMLFGIVSTRFRDLVPIVQSIMQLAFFMTPIVWIYQDLLDSPNPTVRERAALAELNPFLHFLEIVRAPLLGQDQQLHHWVVVLAITVVGWALTFLVLRRYRARVPYWV